MARASKGHGEDSSTLVPETSTIAFKSQRETEETEGGYEELKDEAGVYDEETKRSTMMKEDACDKELKQSTSKKAYACNKEPKRSTREDEGQVDPKDVITKSNKDDTSVEVTYNSNKRVYHESGKSGKHEMWSLKDLEASMHLTNGPLRVLNNSILIRPSKGMHGTRKDDKRKLDDNGDDRDEDVTCARHEALCSRGAKGTIATRHGNAKSEQRIWWIGWQRRFG